MALDGLLDDAAAETGIPLARIYELLECGYNRGLCPQRGTPDHADAEKLVKVGLLLPFNDLEAGRKGYETTDAGDIPYGFHVSINFSIN